MTIINRSIVRSGRLIVPALLLLLALTGRASAQDIPTVVFPTQTITIASAFETIERQTPYLISVNHTDFDISAKVRVGTSVMPLTTALERILAGTGRDFVIRTGHILIVPSEKKEAVPEKKTVRFDAPEKEPVRQPAVKPEPEKTPVAEAVREPEAQPEVVAGEVVSPEEAAAMRREAAGAVVARNNYLRPPMRFALKTNLLYGVGTLTPNFAAEFAMGRRSTLDVAVGYNPWNMNGTDSDNRKLGHWIVQPEYRWWLCERFNGHFFGAHVFGGQFNISEHKIPLLFGEKDSQNYRYDGWMVGAGVSYGYQLMLGKAWNLEFNVGVGYGRMFYDRYESERCGELIQKDARRNYFGPTKAGITIMYLIK